MADEKEEPNPIVDMFAVDDEEARTKPLPEPELNVDAPEDKKEVERERGEDGKFKSKDEKADAKKDEKVEEKPKKTDDTVPLAKFLDEKNRLKAELEARDLTIKEFNAKIAALEAKLPKPEPEAEPDFVEDPKAYVDTKLQKALAAVEAANKTVAEQGKKAEETALNAREQVELQQFLGNLQQHEQRFVAANPDYHDALNHIREIRAYQLQQFEPGITQEQIIEVIRREEINLAASLARAGRDPVSTAYELAKKYGYQPKTAAPPKGNGAAPPDNSRKLPPDQSLGGGGGAPDVVEDDAKQDEVDTALASLFRRRA